MATKPPATTEPLYKRIYWDTNILIHEKWPEVSAAMTQALDLGNSLNVEAVLLKHVEKEIEAHWSRGFVEAREKLGPFRQTTQRVGLVMADPVSHEDALDAYHNTVDKIGKKHKLTRRAPPYRDSESLFEMAIHQTKPFGEKGRNFQDVVICLAAIEDLAVSGVRSGIFVSDDKAFDQATLDVHARSKGLKLKLLESVDGVLEYFRTHLLEAKQSAWAHREQLAGAAVKESLPQIAAYIAKNFEIPVNADVQSISGFQVGEIDKVQTPDPDSFSDGDIVTITARLLLVIEAKVRRYSSVFAPREVMKVGQERKGITYRSISMGTLGDEKMPMSVSLELKARYMGDHFADLEPVSVSAGGGEWSNFLAGIYESIY